MDQTKQGLIFHVLQLDSIEPEGIEDILNSDRTILYNVESLRHGIYSQINAGKFSK